MGLVEKSHRGCVSTAISLVINLGIIASGPLMASAFQAGMAMDGIWLGLPFMVAALLFFGASCATFSIRRCCDSEEG